MRKAFLYLSYDQKLFKEFSKDFCKDIYKLSTTKDTYIVYGNGTISKVVQNLITNKIIGYVDIADKNHHPSTLKDTEFDKIIITVLGRV